MAPVILALKQQHWAEVDVLATAQHRGLLDQALSDFGITPDHDLDAMLPDQTLAGLTSRLLQKVDDYLRVVEPELVIAQGDTTTVFVASLACFYRRIPFTHVEAGLRTFDLAYPFPEEFNRVVTSISAKLHFAPTAGARDNLLKEGIDDQSILVTGNTVIDALFLTRNHRPALPIALPDDAQVILMSAHRRENFGKPLNQVFLAVQDLLKNFPRLHVIYPVHPNPNVKAMAETMLGQEARVHLLEPLNYPSLFAALDRCDLVLTDSGGLQEEAPALSKPVLVLRNETERPEAVHAGVAALVGASRAGIVAAVTRLLSDAAFYQSMAKGVSPYGDGHAATRICDRLEKYFATVPFPAG